MSLVAALRRLPLKRRLMLVMLFTSTLGLLLVGLCFGIYEHRRIRLGLVDDLWALSRLVGDRSAAALLRRDPATAAESLGAVRVKPNVLGARIYDETGAVFAAYESGGTAVVFPPPARDRQYRFDRKTLRTDEPILLDGRRIGSVQVVAGLDEFVSLWRQYLLATGFFILCGALIAYFLAARMQRVISLPLTAITETARAVAEHKDYSVRAAKTADAEISVVVQAFNAMLETIESQSHRLDETVRKYRELVEFANSIILRWGADGRVTFLNEYGLRFFGYTAEEIVGKHVIGTLVPPASGEGRDLGELMARICADPEAFGHNVNENMLRDGRRVWISWTNRVVRDEQGQLLGILSVGTDVTEQRKAEEAIREINADLERRVAERTEELAARNRDLERFNRLFVDRELRMKELKQRIKEPEAQEPRGR